ncbi:hypothetical protein PABG_12281 [Paracoccidioides brasiliensis Pb03]|nr:hypothetical protein PABG_12281 [Paracoccidioides brasiliensis Pb03]
MERHDLHLANNHTSYPVSILLPSSSSSKENPTSSRYINIPASSVSTTLDLQTSVFLTDKVTRCSIQDCNAQTSEFGLGPSIDPQEHWKYWIVDANAPDAGADAGLNNENSNCDVTKIKDENAKEKLSKTTINTNRNGDDDYDNHKILMYPHTRKGEFIAEEGCKWAEKALGKEDVEIYMFRLLLE